MTGTKTNQSEKSGQALARRDRETRDVQRWPPSRDAFGDPFEFMSRVSTELDRTFNRLWRDFGLQRRRSWLPQNLFGGRTDRGIWAPRIEAFQKDDKFIVRAELPGIEKDNVEIELLDDSLTIRGQRREEHEEEREGYFHSERQYGEFYRTVPLPEGAIGESAKATFRDGILEVTMQAAPSETRRGRRLEIQDASANGQKQ